MWHDKSHGCPVTITGVVETRQKRINNNDGTTEKNVCRCRLNVQKPQEDPNIYPLDYPTGNIISDK